ncbi:MAG: hypothetical protein JNL82_11485 [Myxococcales bacterium]|nr:hypothetical protein [Myxococcales bacterium]
MLVSLCSIAFASTDAQAAMGGPSTLFGQPVAPSRELSEAERDERRRQFDAMLETRGLERHGDVVGPRELFAPSEPNPATQAEWDYPPHRTTIFLNFFGGEMSGGTNSALMESTCIPSNKFDYPGFSGTEAQALAIIETFVNLLEPYGVRVAYEKAPPPELPYAMVMMGGTPDLVGLPNGVLGVSCSSDCGDRWWRDTTLAFTAAASPNQTNTLSTTALHEAAHAFGLAHIDTSQNSPLVMHPYVDNSPKVWGDQCEEYNAATGGINCQSTHDYWCPGGAQNTHAELLAYFGPNGPDTEPPLVEILAPEDGLELEAGASVDLEVAVTDNHDGAGWKLMVYKDDVLAQEQPTFNFQTKWALSGLPTGTYRLRVEGIDHDRNVGADEVTLYVGVEAPMPGSSSGDDPTTSGGTTDDTGSVPTGSAGGTGQGEGGGSSSTTMPNEEGEDGCSCLVSGRTAPALTWAVLFAGFVRRRKSRSRPWT